MQFGKNWMMGLLITRNLCGLMIIEPKPDYVIVLFIVAYYSDLLYAIQEAIF